MEYHSAIKRNKTGSFVETCMDLQTLTQREVRENRKTKKFKRTFKIIFNLETLWHNYLTFFKMLCFIFKWTFYTGCISICENIKKLKDKI